MLDDHTFGVEQSEPQGGFARWRRHYRPAWVAAAWFWMLFFLTALAALLFGWASLPVTLSLQTFMALGAGAFAAVLLHREARAAPHYGRMGAAAGAGLVVTTFVVVLAVGLWVGIGTFGAALPLMLPYFFSLPLALVVCGGAGAFGSRAIHWLLQRWETRG